MSHRNTLLAWFAAIASVLAIVGTLAYHSIDGLVEDARLLAHTHEVIETLNGVMALIAGAESSQRGYVITGNADYLGRYHAARPQLELELQRLGMLVADNKAQSERAGRLATLVAARIDVMQAVVDDRERGFEAAQRRILTNEGRQIMLRVRQRVDEMLGVERDLAAQRRELAAQSARYAIVAGGTGLGLIVAIMLMLLQAVSRENRRREAVERRLHDNNQDLALSLENTRRLGAELSTMSAMSELLHSCRSLDEARPIIARSLQQLLPETSGAITLLNASQNLMDSVIEWGDAAGGAGLASETTFVPDQCWAVRRGRPHVVANTRDGQLCGHLKGSGPVPPAYACLPMMAQGEAIGAMFAQGAAIDDEQVRLLRTSSEQIALALANLKLQESLRTQSIRDPLTGLFNRRYLEVSLEREVSRARRGKHPVCVIMLDIDHFKRFNDTFGHDAGDSVLVEFASVLKAAGRDDDIASRYGGEEFTLVMPDSSVEVARERAELIRSEVRKLRVEHRRRPLGTITVSLGIAAFPGDGTTVASLIQAADAALYHAKESGRDRVALAAEMPKPG